MDFWDKFDFETMKLKHERKMYPPRVKMTIIMDKPIVIVPVKFKGCTSESQLQLDMELVLAAGLS